MKDAKSLKSANPQKKATFQPPTPKRANSPKKGTSQPANPKR